MSWTSRTRKQKMLALLLTGAVAFSAFGTALPAKAKAITQDKIDFSQPIDEDDELWTNQNSRIEDGVCKSAEEGGGGVFGFSYNKEIAVDGAYGVDFDITASVDVGEDLHSNAGATSFFGLRIPQKSLDPQQNAGLWFAIRNNQIGIRSMPFPEVSYMDIPYSFENGRHIYFEDNLKTNTVNIYVDNDEGKRELVSVVKIRDGQYVDMFSPANMENPVVSEKLYYQVFNQGYVMWWNHVVSGTQWDNATVSYDNSKQPAYQDANKLAYVDLYEDTWAATDDLGRKTPTFAEAGSPKGKTTGMFYFVWHTSRRSVRPSWKIYDHYKAYLEGGVDAVWEILTQGEPSWPHHWAEPYFGYYLSDDEWVIRKHASMLSDAGVDFIFFDCTNGETFVQNTKTLLQTYKKMRDEGQKTPQVVFNIGRNVELSFTFDALWEQYFKDGNFKDLWFMWQGKPLILTDPSVIPEDKRDFFTIRTSWAFNEWTGDGIGKWPWIAESPQLPGRDPETKEVEQMPVACGFHVNTSRGRSFHNGQQETDGAADFEFGLMETTTPKGLAFEEQWGYALDQDPKLVMLTGWNEWTAGRWEGDLALIANTYYADINDPVKKSVYIDAFNPEFSRDLEPMNGGFKDNYYYQTVINNRKFKGVRPVPAASGQKTIDISRGFDQWNSVWPVYYDTPGDTFWRDFQSYVCTYQYVNETGRNDLLQMKVSQDEENWYFYAKTADDITPNEGTNWMNLYIDADQSHETGWYGYDFLINRMQKEGFVSVEQNVDGAYRWKNLGKCPYKAEGNEIQIAVPKALLPIDGDFEFKWADNSTKGGDIMEFLDLGDAAPNARFNYVYTQTENEVALSEGLKNVLSGGTVAMAVNKNHAYAGGKQVKIDPDNTNITPFVLEGKTVVPVRFLAESLGAQVDWDNQSRTVTVESGETQIKLVLGEDKMLVNGVQKALQTGAVSVNGRTFLPLRDISEALGQTVTWDDRGVIFVGPAEVTDTTLIDELWQKL